MFYGKIYGKKKSSIALESHIVSRTPRTLTFREVNAIKKPGYTALGGATGLYLYVAPSGGRYYFFRFKAKDGKRSAVSLGSFSSMDLSEARKMALEWKARLSKGENPSAVKKEQSERTKREQEALQQEKERKLRTFLQVSQNWLLERARSGYWKNNSTGESHAQTRLDRYINPKIGNIPIHELRSVDVLGVVKDIYRSKPVTADRCIITVSAVWKWAAAMGLCSGENPADRHGSLGVLLEPYKFDRKKKRNFGALDYTEVPAFIAELQKMSGISARMTEFAILTALRSKMVRYIRWEDVDLKNSLVTISERSNKVKGRGEFTVFLSTQAKRILESLPRINDWVFCSSRIPGPMSDMAMSKIFKMLNEQSLQSGGAGWLDRQQSKTLGFPVLATVHGTARASFKTWARTGSNRRKFDDDAVELCLAHKLPDQYDGAYNRAQLEPERRAVMQAWGDFCYSKIDR